MSTEKEKPPPASSREGDLEDVAPKLESSSHQEIDADQDTYIGVKAAEAVSKVYGRYSKWFLYVRYVFEFTTRTQRPYTNRRCFSIALAAYFFSLDDLTMPNYLTFAVSAYDKQSLISAIGVAQSSTSTRFPCQHFATINMY